ncbi:MAG: hypothetical protein KGZ74_12565 [Chitinophagaceae bacterium]|nr:hypothetical protein [Chitinophagaceae bacterium]
MKRTLSFLFFLFPLSVFAHGEEVLISVLLEFITFIIVLVFLFSIRLHQKKKAYLFLFYFLSVVGVNYFINSMPYRENKTMINIIGVAIPLSVTFLGWLFYKKASKDVS